jgi:hypothetical protein
MSYKLISLIFLFLNSFLHPICRFTKLISRKDSSMILTASRSSFCFAVLSIFHLLVHSRCRGVLISLDHTQVHTTVGRTPLDEGSARRSDLYVTTQTLYKTNNHAPGGIRTHDPSKRSAADLRLVSFLLSFKPSYFIPKETLLISELTACRHSTCHQWSLWQ